MGDNDMESGLLNISLSDSEGEGQADIDKGAAADTDTQQQQSRADRTALSEPAFQVLRATYRPKVENGEIWRSISLPLGSTPRDGPGSGSGLQKLSKPEAQEVVHAAEELYFFGRFAEAVQFVRGVLLSASSDDGGGLLDDETRALLRYYETRCAARIAAAATGAESGDDAAAAAIQKGAGEQRLEVDKN
ncbi:hypothetical protein B0T26DRAFT_692810 [Lasiosphaeria miniovina]|uniref:Uncharacterized protein n=1 Tax=Lasiosphaeria miniovina TaxID=1954250 RepID=A0AA40B3J7_9PEZI|nr:uncharacterized protein B0T26DRAFT_692810 [Lasiosphaeria miniovina]KAK0727033.1 hypothetical protein B0T26DRAFT_692810 [Lasiosphaeria miniovina]